MSQRQKPLRNGASSPSATVPSGMLPLGAMLLAGSFNALAQTAPSAPEKTLPTVVVREQAMAPEGKDALKEQIMERIQELLEESEIEVEDVLFSDFVIQF